MQYQGWVFNGLTIGNGTNLSIIETDGFDDLPPVRSADVDKAAAHGAFAGLDVLGERTMTIKFALLGSDRPSYDALVQQLSAAFAVQSTELPLLCGDNGNRLINCRPRKAVAPRKKDFHGTFSTEVMVELVATDPRIYSATLSQPSTGLSSSSGGMTFNATFPLSFGSIGSGGLVTVTNAGSFPTDATFSISGPIVNPIIDNVTTGVSILLGITLAASDTLVLDTLAKSIVLNGTASRTSALLPGSAWRNFPPGSTQVRYRNNGAFTASQMRVAFRSAWLALASGGA